MIFKPSGIVRPLIEKMQWHKTTIGHKWRKLWMIRLDKRNMVCNII